MKLYWTRGTCVLAVLIALEDAGASYDSYHVAFKDREQRGAAFLKLNPKGRVPALETDRGILTEVPAILAYIAQTYPDADLAPLDDAFAMGEIHAFNAYLCATVHVAHAHRVRGERWADETSSHEDMQRKVPETMAACFDLIEKEMLRGPWVMGDRYTICDGYLFTICQWLEGDSVDIARFPKIEAHAKRMAARPATQKAVTFWSP